MTVIYVHLMLAALLVALAVFDAISTLQAFKKGAHEANLIMAWLQNKLPKGWIYVRIGLGVAVALLSFAAPEAFGTAFCALAAMGWGYVVINNYSIAWRN